MTKRLLTNRERILYLLSRYDYDPDEDYVADHHLSQDGISDFLDMRKNNVSRELSDLKEEGLVEEKKARVEGFDRRRKIYVLTEKGRKAKTELEAELKKKEIKMQTKREGNTLVSVKEAVERLNEKSGTGEKIEPLHIAEWMRKRDVLDPDEFTPPSQASKEESTEVLKQVPAKKEIYGRSEEIDTLVEKLETEDPPIIILEGMAGMGKTALGGKLLDEIRGEIDALWYSFHRWEDKSSFVEVLNDFCVKSCGEKIDPGLSLPEIARKFLESVGSSKSVFFFDDCEKLPSDIKPFLEILLREKREGKKFTAILMTRETLGFYEVRDELRDDIFKLELEPLEKEGIKRMLDIDESQADEVYEKTKGHPLYLELYEKHPTASSKMREFLEKEVYSALDEEEREMLQHLSVFWDPVKKDMVVEKGDFDKLMGLKKENILKETDEGKVDLHSILKEFFYEHTSLERKKELHTLAAERLRKIENEDRDLEILYHLEKAGEVGDALEKMEGLASRISQLDESFRDEIFEAFPEDELTEEKERRYLILRGDIHSKCEEWEKAAKFYKKAKRRKEDRGLEEKLADTKMRLEKWEDTIESHNRALSRYKKKEDTEGQFREYLSLGMVYRKKGEYDKAETFYEKAESLIDELEEEREAKVSLYNNLGMLYLSRNEYKKAEKVLKKALKKGGKDAILHENLSIVFEKIGDLDKALDHLNKSIDINMDEENYRDVVELLMRASDILVNKNKFDSAIAKLREALRFERKMSGSSWIFGGRKKFSEREISIHKKLAEVFRNKGEWKNCIDHRKKVIEMYDKIEDVERASREKLKYAFDLSDHGKSKEALNVLKEVEEELERLGIEAGITAARLERARIYRTKGEYSKGESLLEELIEKAKSRDDVKAVEAGEKILREIRDKMGKS